MELKTCRPVSELLRESKISPTCPRSPRHSLSARSFLAIRKSDPRLQYVLLVLDLILAIGLHALDFEYLVGGPEIEQRLGRDGHH